MPARINEAIVADECLPPTGRRKIRIDTRLPETPLVTGSVRTRDKELVTHLVVLARFDGDATEAEDSYMVGGVCDTVEISPPI